MHTQVLGIAGAMALVLAVPPAAAQARPGGAHPTRVPALRATTMLPRVAETPAARLTTRGSPSTAADQIALSAYHDYLIALNAASSISAKGDTLIVDGVSNTCPGALSDLNSLSAGQLKKSALTDFADEVDADLDLAYMAATKPALATLATALTGLEWSATSQYGVTTRLIRAERTLLGTAESDLCTDATTLDAAPLSEPSATTRFLARYRRAATNLHAAVNGFQTLLSTFETKSERKLVAQINTLVSQFSTASGSTEQADASTVLSELGIDSSPSSSS